MKKGILILLFAALALPAVAAEPTLDTLTGRYSYAMGARLAQALQAQGIREVDAAALASAIDDVLAGRPLRMTEADMLAAVQARRGAQATANAEAGRAYLAEHGRQPGVVTLPSGLQFEVLRPGDGAQPAATDTVRVHYHGTRIDGVVFDSSVERGEPAEFPLGGVIPGFREAITRMQVGGQWRIVIPGELAYGERGAGRDIGPNETLIFEITLLDIVQ